MSLISLAQLLKAKYDLTTSLLKIAFIRKMPNGKWKVVSRKGKNLGVFPTKEQAVKRLRQIEYFKHHKGSADIEEVIDLSHLPELSFSAIMRELRKQCDEAVVNQFLSIFKQIFDQLILLSEAHPAEKTLPAALTLFSKLHQVKIRKDEDD